MSMPPPPSGPMPPVNPPQPGGPLRYDVPSDVKNLALLSTLGMLIVGFLAPLIVYLVTNDDPQKVFAKDHAREGLNFSITFFAVMVASGILMVVLIGFVTMILGLIWGLWVIIAGAIQANNGEAPNYPLVPKILS